MKFTFITERGKVECVRDETGMGGIAYFFRDDYEIPIEPNGIIKHFDGATFRILWPIRGMKSEEAVLQILDYRTIGRVRSE